tara:strand:+ start:649 stop:882 length:234 start_codon:yes stop_codon:yes gene_type:complete
MVEIRAKSVIKITTGKNNLDHEYTKGTQISGVVKDMLHALVQEVGTAKAKEIVSDKLSTYPADYLGLESHYTAQNKT